MAVNKVVYGGNTLLDLTADTIVASALLSGYTAHDKSGAAITGAHQCGAASVATGTLELSSASQTMSITGIGFTPTSIMLILTSASGTTNSKVRSASGSGTSLDCQYYSGAGLLGTIVTTGNCTGTITASANSVALDTGSGIYTFLSGTWTWVAWA